MVLNIKGRNAKKSRKEFEKLEAEVMRRRKVIEEKYKEVPYPPGLDTNPAEKELAEVSKYFSKEVKRIKSKYGIE